MATNLKLDLIVDDKGSAVIKGFGTNSQKAMEVAKMGAVGLGVGLAGATAGLYAMNQIMTEAVGLANVQEKAEAKLAAVLQSTGHAAGYNIDQLKGMAAGLQNVTTVGDETIINGMGILATFKQVQGEAFERTTAVALDMSDVMGQDLKSSMVQLGKAINDPTKGLSALTKVGVTFSDEQKKQIQILQESGDLYGAQAVMLAELESEFGGAARAARETFGGAVTAAQNSLGDMKEELGFVITKNQFFIGLVKLAEGQFQAWGKTIQENRQYLQELAKSGIVAVIGGIETALEVMRFFHNGWSGLRLVGSMATEVLATGLHVLYEGLRIALMPLDELFKALVKIGTMDSNPFDGMSRGLKDFKLSSGDVVEQVKSDMVTTNAMYDLAGKKIGAMKEAIKAIPVEATKTTVSQVKGLKEVAAVVGKTEKEKTADRKKADKDAAKLLKDAKAAEEKAIKETASAYSSMFGDLKWDAKGFYDYKVRLLRAEAQEYKDKTGDSVLAEQWLTAQIKGLDAEKVASHKEAEAKKLMASDDFFGGFRAGLDQAMADQQNWAEVGADLAQEMTESMTSSFSDFINPLSDGFGDLGAMVNSVFENMVNAAADAVAKMAVEWAIAEGMSFISDLFFSHSGTWKVKPNEAGVIVKKDQMILPSETSDAVRGTFGSFDALQDFADSMAGKSDSFSSLSDAERAGLAAAGRTMGLRAAAGVGLMAGGQITAGDFAKGMTSAGAMVGYGSAAITGFATNALGVKSGKVSDLFGLFGQVVGNAAAGPAGAVAGGTLGQMVGDMVGDIANARDNEAVRDAIEAMNPGYFAGRQATRGLQAIGGEFGSAAAWGGMDPAGGESTGGGAEAGSGRGGSGETSSDASGGMGGVKHGGWRYGPMTGYQVEHHGGELTLNEDQVKAVRELNAGGGSGAKGDLIIPINIGGTSFGRVMIKEFRTNPEVKHAFQMN